MWIFSSVRLPRLLHFVCLCVSMCTYVFVCILVCPGVYISMYVCVYLPDTWYYYYHYYYRYRLYLWGGSVMKWWHSVVCGICSWRARLTERINLSVSIGLSNGLISVRPKDSRSGVYIVHVRARVGSPANINTKTVHRTACYCRPFFQVRRTLTENENTLYTNGVISM